MAMIKKWWSFGVFSYFAKNRLLLINVLFPMVMSSYFQDMMVILVVT